MTTSITALTPLQPATRSESSSVTDKNQQRDDFRTLLAGQQHAGRESSDTTHDTGPGSDVAAAGSATRQSSAGSDTLADSSSGKLLADHPVKGRNGEHALATAEHDAGKRTTATATDGDHRRSEAALAGTRNDAKPASVELIPDQLVGSRHERMSSALHDNDRQPTGHDDDQQGDGQSALAALLGALPPTAAVTTAPGEASYQTDHRSGHSQQTAAMRLSGAGAPSAVNDHNTINAMTLNALAGDGDSAANGAGRATDDASAILAALNNAEGHGSKGDTLSSALQNTIQTHSALAATDGSAAAGNLAGPYSPAPLTPPPATPAAPLFTATLTPQLQAEGWDQAFNSQVMRLSSHGGGSAELHLNPQDLGQLQLSLKLNDHQAQLQVVSPHAHVRAAVEASLGQLRDAFAASGIELGQTSVSDQSSQQSGFGFQQSHQPRSQGFDALGDSDDSVITRVLGTRPGSGIDLFA